MHIYLLTRGIKHDVDRFVNELSAKYLPFEVKGKDLEHINMPAGQYQNQVAVRPIQLFEVVFPREHKDVMLNTLFHGQYGAKTQHRKHDKFIWGMRKVLGVSPIPETFDKSKKLALYQGAVELIGVGIKEDYNFKDGTEAL